jgi:hypothetical protein
MSYNVYDMKVLFSRGTWQEEETGHFVASAAVLQAENSVGANPAWSAVHQEAADNRHSAVPQPSEPSEVL